VAESTGAANVPAWFLGMGIPIVVGLAGEGAYRKSHPPKE